MGSYYGFDPAELGLRELDSVGTGFGSDWDKVYVFVNDETGDMYSWSGTGCSCRGPMQGVRGIADLTPVRSISEFAIRQRGWARSYNGNRYSGNRELPFEVGAMVQKMRDFARAHVKDIDPEELLDSEEQGRLDAYEL